MLLRHQKQSTKTDKLDIIKTFKFCIPKVRAEPKGIPHTQEKICANHRSDEGLI